MDTTHHKTKPTHLDELGLISPRAITSTVYRQPTLIRTHTGLQEAGMSQRSAYVSCVTAHTYLSGADPWTRFVWSHKHGSTSNKREGIRYVEVDLYFLFVEACWDHKQSRGRSLALLPTLCHYLMQELAVGVLREADMRAVVEEVFGHIISYRDIGLSIERTAYVLNECEALTLPMLLRALYCVALHVRSGHPLFSHTNF